MSPRSGRDLDPVTGAGKYNGLPGPAAVRPRVCQSVAAPPLVLALNARTIYETDPDRPVSFFACSTPRTREAVAAASVGLGGGIPNAVAPGVMAQWLRRETLVYRRSPVCEFTLCGALVRSKAYQGNGCLETIERCIHPTRFVTRSLTSCQFPCVPKSSNCVPCSTTSMTFLSIDGPLRRFAA